jgi:hypothetical protein
VRGAQQQLSENSMQIQLSFNLLHDTDAESRLMEHAQGDIKRGSQVKLLINNSAF